MVSEKKSGAVPCTDLPNVALFCDANCKVRICRNETACGRPNLLWPRTSDHPHGPHPTLCPLRLGLQLNVLRTFLWFTFRLFLVHFVALVFSLHHFSTATAHILRTNPFWASKPPIYNARTKCEPSKIASKSRQTRDFVAAQLINSVRRRL